jgi:hypothetical protein
MPLNNHDRTEENPGAGVAPLMPDRYVELVAHLIDLRDLAAADGYLCFAGQVHSLAELALNSACLLALHGDDLPADARAAYDRLVATPLLPEHPFEYATPAAVPDVRAGVSDQGDRLNP